MLTMSQCPHRPLFTWLSMTQVIMEVNVHHCDTKVTSIVGNKGQHDPFDKYYIKHIKTILFCSTCHYIDHKSFHLTFGHLKFNS